MMTLIDLSISFLRPTVTYFKLDRSFCTDMAQIPFTITSASLKSIILNQGLCRPSCPFEEDRSGRHIISTKHDFCFSTGKLKVVVLLTKSKETILIIATPVAS